MQYLSKNWLMALLLLCPVWCNAEKITHDFNALASTTTFANSNSTATLHKNSDTTYTCSGHANAHFGSESTTVVAQLYGSGAQMTVSPAINDLDSIHIVYNTGETIDFDVYISSDDGENWTKTGVVIDQNSKGNTGFKMPGKGNYMVQIRRKSTNVYIKTIDYITKPCHCLRITTE